MYRPQLHTLPEVAVARIRAELPASEVAAATERWAAEIMNHVTAAGATPGETLQLRTRPAGPEQVELEVALPLATPLAGGPVVAGHIERTRWPGGLQARVSLRESPPSSAEAALQRWAQAERRVLLAPPWQELQRTPGGRWVARTLSVPVSEPQPELILASTSSARRALMDGLGLPYRCEAPGVTEEVSPGTPVADAVALLAERKARAVAARNPGALVLGADQLVSLEGTALGKPADRAAARRQLGALLGRTHQILTGVCLIDGAGAAHRCVDVAELTVAALPPEALERYLDLGEWEGCAGAYRVEGQGQALFEQIAGDRTSVQGLPMLRVLALLREVGAVPFRLPVPGPGAPPFSTRRPNA